MISLRFKKKFKKLLSIFLILSIFFLNIGKDFTVYAFSQDKIVDNMWEARNDPSVVDTFLTIEETLKKNKEEKNNSRVVYNEANSTSNSVEYLGFTENSSFLESKSNNFFNSISNLFIKKIIKEDPGVEIITKHQYPKKGEKWNVRFKTKGVGDLTIKPVGESTVVDDDFIGLWCGNKKQEAVLLEGDIIFVKNWQCDDIATVSHMTINEGRHLLDIKLENANAYAHNGPNTYRVMGSFKDGITLGTFGGNASINVRQPDPAAGDLMVAVIAIRPSTDIVTTPSGWTSLGSQSGTDGAAEGADTGSARIYTMYKIAAGTEGITNQTFAESGTPSVWGIKIFRFRSSTGQYDIATSSYGINADTTTFGTTLSNNDLAFQSGDSVLLASTLNGDLASFSTWNITSTGASFGTVSEILDSNSTTGNDIRFGAAITYVTGGTGQSPPTTTVTISAAASGAVTVLRIRQNGGANRNDTFVRGCGVPAAGTTSVAPSYPENEDKDLLLLFVGVRNSTVTPTTPTNWTSIGNYTGGVGTFGIDAGNAKIQTFYRVVNGAPLTGTQSVTLTSGSTAGGQICAVHRDGAYSWNIDSDGGSDNTAGTAWSVTGSGIDLSSNDGGDVVFSGNAINTDAYTYSAHALAATGITFSDFNESSRLTTANGNDSSLNVVSGEVSSGSATGVAPTYTMTASGSGVSAPAGASMFLAVRASYKPYDGRRVKLISNKIVLNQGGRLKINQQL